MHYYRRKPLDALSNKDRETSPGNAVGLEGRRRTLTPLSASAEPLSWPVEQTSSSTAQQTSDAGERSVAPSNPMEDAAALVYKAASILGEEMAAGVLAARDARGSVFGPGALQSGAKEKLLRDIHDFIDTIAELAGQAQGPVGEWLRAAGLPGSDAEEETVPILRPRESVQAGGETTISFKLHNDDAQPARLTLRCTDLLSSQGYRIPEYQLVFAPGEFQLEPDAVVEVNFRVGVPPGTPAGVYSGLLIASGLPYLRAVIAVEVI